MQNKGIVICVAVLLTLASIFYLSFSFATRYYDSEAAKIKDPIAQQDYKDSVKYLGVYSYQNCLETQIGLGLDLKGGMNVILEISVPDVIENLADHKTDAGFTNAMKEARAQEEAKEIVRYAAERYITVIPEIDMPGHMLAALASYPELGCTGGPYEIAPNFGVFREVLCGGNEKTLQFAKDVINEIMDIFPSPYIHIGGDECPKFYWKTCAKCQRKIRELGLKDTKEHTKENQLQAWFMGEVEKEIQKRGREMMAWNEILKGNPAKSTIVMAWTKPEARLKSIEGGYRTIACPIQYLYFSNAKFNELRGLSSIDRVYSFEPVPEEATPEQKKNIMGAQACIWTEWTKDSVKMEWQMMPRIAALAEIQWSKPENKNIQDFMERLKHQLDIYKVYGYNYKEDIHEAWDK